MLVQRRSSPHPTTVMSLTPPTENTVNPGIINPELSIPDTATTLPPELSETEVLEKLHEITRELGRDTTEDAIKSRLQGAFPTWKGAYKLSSSKKVNVLFTNGKVLITTSSDNKKYFEGTWPRNYSLYSIWLIFTHSYVLLQLPIGAVSVPVG